jgi:phospholipid N-methyltransferase
MKELIDKLDFSSIVQHVKPYVSLQDFRYSDGGVTMSQIISQNCLFRQWTVPLLARNVPPDSRSPVADQSLHVV